MERCSDGGDLLLVRDAERGTTAAGRDHVRVLDLEAGPLEPVHEVDHGSLHVRKARAIDEQANPLVLEDGVAVALLIERERVLEPRAAAASNPDPQPGGLDDRRLSGEEFVNLLGTLVGESDHCFIQYSDGFVRATLLSVSVDPAELKDRIEAGIPGARARVSGDGHHFEAVVSAAAFAGMSRIAQHKLVHDVFGSELGDRIHALSIKTTTTENADE